MIASFLAFTRMKGHGRLRSFVSPGKGEANLRARAEKALTLCRLQDSSRKPPPSCPMARKRCSASRWR